MSALRLHEWTCTVHNFRFAHERRPSGDVIECPICLRVELHATMNAMADVTAQRDMLLKAIDLKRTLTKRPRGGA